jgi:hypothetical protein
MKTNHSYGVLMRVLTRNNPNQTAATYAGDTANGTLIYCSVCHTTFETTSKPDEALACLGCNTELFYPPWCEW